LVLLAAAGLGTGLWFWVQTERHTRDREAGLRLVRESRFADAEPILARVFARDANDVEVVKALVRVALAQNTSDAQQPGQLVRYLSRWCELQPNEIEPFRLRVKFATEEGNLDQAVADSEHLLQLVPNDLVLRQQVLGFFIYNGLHEKVERYCRHMSSDKPVGPDILYLWAEACHGLGKNEEARRLLERALALRPGALDAQLLLAILDCDAGHDERAIPFFQQLLAQNPAVLPARYHLSLALTRTGKTAEANVEMAEFLKRTAAERLLFDSRFQPDNLELQVRAAEALWTLGRTDEARGLVRTILSRDPHLAAATRLQKTIDETQPAGTP
jgi:tetratricopeptide (TPR) repeat protein